MGANPVSCPMSVVRSYDVNKFFPIFYEKSWTLHRLISLNKQSDDKRINFNCDIRVFSTLGFVIHLSGLEKGHLSF